MAEGAILESPEEVVTDAEVVEDGQEEQAEVPSVFSVITRHIVGSAEVSPPAQDGSRLLRLHSANGGTIIEASLSGNLSEFISVKLAEVEIIEEDADAGPEE